RLVKLADKIANLRDLIESPPADWPAYRRREYFAWTAEVVASLRGTHARLEALFDDVQAQRPAHALEGDFRHSRIADGWTGPPGQKAPPTVIPAKAGIHGLPSSTADAPRSPPVRG